MPWDPEQVNPAMALHNTFHSKKLKSFLFNYFARRAFPRLPRPQPHFYRNLRDYFQESKKQTHIFFSQAAGQMIQPEEAESIDTQT